MSQTKAQLLDGSVVSVSFGAGSAAAPSINYSADSTTGIYFPGSGQLAISTNSSPRLAINSSGAVTIPGTLGVTGAITGSSTITSAAGTATATGIQVGTGTTYAPGIYSPGTDQLAISTGGTGRVFVDASGNVGVGGAASAWQYTALSVGFGGSAVSSDAVDKVQLGANFYRGSGADRFTGTGFATLYQQNAGAHVWFRSSASGTAGNAIPFTQAMTLDASGNLALGATSTLRPFYVAKTGYNTGGGWYSIAKTVDGSDNKGFDFGYDNTSQTSILVANTSFAASNLAFWTYSGLAWGERARIDSSGRLLVGTSSDSGGALFQVNGDRIRIGTAKTPASASATGAAGEICWDASYIYVCTATNTWKRTAIATW